MKGLTILNNYFVSGEILMPWLAVIVGGIILGTISVLIVCNCEKFFKNKLKLQKIILIVSAAVIAGSFLIGAIAPREQEEIYQVLIDESVSFVEFTEQYEIVEQNGLIYTIKEKND